MSARLIRITTLGFCALLVPMSLDATDEPRFRVELEKTVPAAERVLLKAPGADFLALMLKAQGPRFHGGVILLHGRHAHPDWAQVIKPLRQALPKHGWASLSIQMPVLTRDKPLKDHAALFDQALPRIEAAIAHLKEQKISPIVILGYELGGTMAVYYLAKTPKHELRGLILVSLISEPGNPHLDANINLAAVQIPVLDVFGLHDQEFVHKALVPRRAIKNSRHRVLEMVGADHSYWGHEEELIKRIRGWLSLFVAPGATGEQ